MARTTRGVSFNLDDPIESKLNDYFNNVNFSKYVKRLLERELLSSGTPIQTFLKQPEPPVKEQVQPKFPTKNANSFI